MYPTAKSYLDINKTERKQCEQVSKMLTKLPKNATITSSTFLIPHLYSHKKVYMYPSYYDESKYTTYIAVDKRYEYEELYDFMGNQYELTDSCGFCEIWKKK